MAEHSPIIKCWIDVDGHPCEEGTPGARRRRVPQAHVGVIFTIDDVRTLNPPSSEQIAAVMAAAQELRDEIDITTQHPEFSTRTHVGLLLAVGTVDDAQKKLAAALRACGYQRNSPPPTSYYDPDPYGFIGDAMLCLWNISHNDEMDKLNWSIKVLEKGLAAASTGPADRLHELLLTDKQAAVLEVLKALPKDKGLMGLGIIQKLRERTPRVTVTISVLTRHIIPVLKNRCRVKNKRGVGYFIDTD